jgi:hypothetical protein
MTVSATSPHHYTRVNLDRLFWIDSVLSMIFGVVALTAPHTFVVVIAKKDDYNHSVHETLRLYACLRIACGWILWHMRRVDDGLLRRNVCEALFVCYVLQALTVLRAQFTDKKRLWINWLAIGILLVLSVAYGSFRFGKGGNLIKIYELPTSTNRR